MDLYCAALFTNTIIMAFFFFFAYTYTSGGGFEDPVKSGMSTDFCATRALIADFKTMALWF